MVDWVAVQTNFVTNTGIVVFVDADTGDFPCRFYRTRAF
jgi:hypothetical protein